ncbi:MAG: hypothetical protein DHS20C16_05280 [Phycisphaerae bacterium]|nr:MAG: hypothetical protein DHS20C16_05280 [Phycisphaerae bacterium]
MIKHCNGRGDRCVRRWASPIACCLALHGFLGFATAHGAQKLVETIAGSDFDIGQTPVVQNTTGTTGDPITGIGFTALWTSVVADEENGVYPWSVDLGVNVTAPDGSTMLEWDPLGGDVTIADFPLQDFTDGFPSVSGVGNFSWQFTNDGVPSPYVSGLRNVSYHLLTTVPDVVEVINGSVATGPNWDRPFFIDGISGQGPVIYDVVRFEVSEAGGYTFHSVVPSGNNFNFLYQNAFDPEQPLVNLLDYGLGNGFAQNGTPAGTSLIEVLLQENTTYYYVTSQWAFFNPGQTFTTTITGPALISKLPFAQQDFDQDGDVDVADHAVFADCMDGPGATPTPTIDDVDAAECLSHFDEDADNDVDLADFVGMQAAFTG